MPSGCARNPVENRGAPIVVLGNWSGLFSLGCFITPREGVEVVRHELPTITMTRGKQVFSSLVSSMPRIAVPVGLRPRHELEIAIDSMLCDSQFKALPITNRNQKGTDCDLKTASVHDSYTETAK